MTDRTEDRHALTGKEICPKCHKKIAPESRAGSLTSYLFIALHCNCAALNKDATLPNWTSEDESDFCPTCGLKIEEKKRDGSLTGFLFQSTRCKCRPDPAMAEGRMSAKFWKLKKGGSDSIFIPACKEIEVEGASSGAIGLAVGAIIGGAYKIVELIGRGGMGEVYLAKHETLDRPCALKVIPPEQVTEMGWQRFQLEAKALAKLEHINLVRVTDLGIHDGCLPYYAMDYIRGQTLADILYRRGRMPLDWVLEIFMQVCDGVDYAHRSGILHRDLKPANIMVTTDAAGKNLAKILDFGLVKLTRHDRSKQSLTSIGDIFGSPFYMSPEQCSGERIDNRSDIYSIGCTIFECLTGRPPFNSHLAAIIIAEHMESDPPTLESVCPGVSFPPAIEVVVAKLLRKNPVERYQTLAQLKADLVLVSQGEDVLPVYLSRNIRQGQEAEDDQGSATLPADAKNTLALRTRVLAAGGILIAAALGIFYYFHMFNKPVADGILPPSTHPLRTPGHDPFLEAERLPKSTKPVPQTEPSTIKWDGKPFYKGQHDGQGIKFRVWCLPPDGEIPFYFVGPHAFASITDNTGKVLVPMEQKAWVVFNKEMFEHRELIGGLTDGAFEGLDLSVGTGSDIAQTTPALARFKSLNMLKLGSASWTADDLQRSLTLINSYPRLEELTLGCPLYKADLLKIKALNKIKVVTLEGRVPVPSDCLKQLCTYGSLQHLVIEAPLSQPSDLLLLATSKSLTRLKSNSATGTKEELTALAKVPHLEELDLPSLRYRLDLGEDLRLLKSVKILKVKKSSVWTKYRAELMNKNLQLTIKCVK